MPSNKELQNSIAEASSRLGVPNNPSGNNATLAKRLSELQERVSALPVTPATSAAPGEGVTGSMFPPVLEEGVENLPLGQVQPPVEGELNTPLGDGTPAIAPGTPEVQPPVNGDVTAPGQSFNAPVQPVKTPEVTDLPADIEAPSDYIVALGKAISTKRGIIGQGKPIYSRDFINPEGFRRAVSRGAVVLK